MPGRQVFSDEAAAPSRQQLELQLEDCQRALAAARDESQERGEALQRLGADLDNFRRRKARELDEARMYAVGPLLESILPVIDSFERGLDESSPAPPAAADHGLRTGIALALREFHRVLGEFGVESIDPGGQRFDPEVHEAIRVESREDLAPGTVSRVFEKGYRLPGRLLRPARVAVVGD